MQVELGVVVGSWATRWLPQTCIYIGAPMANALQISAMISEEFLSLIRCPLTLSSLTIADPALVATVNERVAAGELLNRGGDIVDRTIDGGLISSEETLMYAVRNGIPCLLLDEAIPLDQLEE